MALFDSDGQFIKRIVAEDDEWIGEAVRSGKDGKVAPGKGVNSAVESGLTVMGSDGNAYVMRKSSPAVVYVIANDGRLMRTLKLSADETNLFPSAFFESDRELAVLFSAFGPSERRIKTFHNETGQMIKEASVDDTLGVSVTCFKAPGSFTFIRALDGKFVIHTAELR